MNKVNGKEKTNSLAPCEDGSRITICYGLNKLSGDLYSGGEIYLPKKQNAQLTLQMVKDAIENDINSRVDEKSFVAILGLCCMAMMQART